MGRKEYRPLEDQNFWNMLASVFFAGLIVIALWIVWVVRGGSFPTSISTFDALMITLAAFRMTRLMVYDKITRFFREWFVDTHVEEVDGKQMVALTPVLHGVRGTIHDLLGCPWCIGIWSALIVTFCYFVFSWAWIVIFILAIAGASSFLQLTTNLIGWKAELAKIEAREKEARK